LNIAKAEGATEMRKTQRKIVSGALLCGCALFTLYGASRIAERIENGALPVSITDMENETPVVILDAGHGAST
jgi:N-acetylmuramoyl-L-alanine amidase